METVDVIIPWSETKKNIDRSLNLILVKEWWARCFPEFNLVMSCNENELFNLSAARNAGLKASSADIVIVADADTIPTVAGINNGLSLVREDNWVIPYTWYYNLTEAYSNQLLTYGGAPSPQDGDYDHKILSWSGILMAPRQRIIEVGGWDERFEGWGHEDVAFRLKFDHEFKKHLRTDGYVCHLWHPRDNGETFNTDHERKNRRLFEREYARKYNWKDERV